MIEVTITELYQYCAPKNVFANLNSILQAIVRYRRHTLTHTLMNDFIAITKYEDITCFARLSSNRIHLITSLN